MPRQVVQAENNLGQRLDGAAAILWISAGMGRTAAHDDGGLPITITLTDQRSIRKGGLKEQTEMVPLRRLQQIAVRAGRADFLVGIEKNFPPNVARGGLSNKSFQAFQRHQHDDNATLRIRHARSAQLVRLHERRLLKRRILRINRVHVNAKEYLPRRIRALSQAQRLAQRRFDRLSTRVDLLLRRQLKMLR